MAYFEQIAKFSFSIANFNVLCYAGFTEYLAVSAAQIQKGAISYGQAHHG
jgi:hypothetical protein